MSDEDQDVDQDQVLAQVLQQIQELEPMYSNQGFRCQKGKGPLFAMKAQYTRSSLFSKTVRKQPTTWASQGSSFCCSGFKSGLVADRTPRTRTGLEPGAGTTKGTTEGTRSGFKVEGLSVCLSFGS